MGFGLMGRASSFSPPSRPVWGVAFFLYSREAVLV